MVEYLHFSRAFDKQLKKMRRTGKKGGLAALQSELLIEKIKNRGILSAEVYRKRTRNGEYRIGNCVKYDLGNGYRLVTVRSGRHLYIVFAGTHDETDKWLVHNKYYEIAPADPTYRHEKLPMNAVHDGEVQGQELADDGLFGDPYEELLLKKVDEQTLCQVFEGLFRR